MSSSSQSFSRYHHVPFEAVSDLARAADAAVRYVSARVLTRLLAGVGVSAAARDAGISRADLSSFPAIEVSPPWAAAIGDLSKPQPAYVIPSRFSAALSRALLQSVASEDLVFLSMLADHLAARAELLRWIAKDTRSVAREAARTGVPYEALDTPPRARAGLMGDPVVAMSARDALDSLAVGGSNRVPVESVLSLLAARHAVLGELDLLDLGSSSGLSWPGSAPPESSLSALAASYLHMAAATVRDGGLMLSADPLDSVAHALRAAVGAMPDLPDTDVALVPTGGTDLMQGAPVSAVLRAASASMRRGGAGRGLVGYRGLGPDEPVEVPVIDGWGQPLGLLPSAPSRIAANGARAAAIAAAPYDTPATRPGGVGDAVRRASAKRAALPTVPFDPLLLAWPTVLGGDKSKARDKLAAAARGSMMSVPTPTEYLVEHGAAWPRPVKAPPQDVLTRDGALLVQPARLMASLPAPLAVAWLATARPSVELLGAASGSAVPEGGEGALGLLAWLAMMAHEHDRWLLAGTMEDYKEVVAAATAAATGASTGGHGRALLPDDLRGRVEDLVARCLRLMSMPGKGGTEWLPSLHTATAMLPWATRAALRAVPDELAVEAAGLALSATAELDETRPPENDDYGGVGWTAPRALIEAVTAVQPGGWVDESEPVDGRALTVAATLAGAVRAATSYMPAAEAADATDASTADASTAAEAAKPPSWAVRGGWVLSTTHAAAMTLGKLLPATNAGAVADAMAGWLVEAAVDRMAVLAAAGLLGDEVKEAEG